MRASRSRSCWVAGMIVMGPIAVEMPTAYAAVNCTISAPSFSFAYSALGKLDASSTGAYTVSCTGSEIELGRTTAFTVSMSHPSGSSGWRRMTRLGGTETLTYGVFSDAARTTVFGDGNNGTAQASHAVKFTTLTMTVTATLYGYMPAGQLGRPAGTYIDTSGTRVTVTW